MVIGMDAVSRFEPLPAHPFSLDDRIGAFFATTFNYF
jgi:hypothetical protein